MCLYACGVHLQVIKVDDCSYVKVINRGMDDLVMISHWYFAGRHCSACRRELASSSSSGPTMQCCDCEVAQYCSAECMQRHKLEHSSHCKLCQELMQVVNVDMDRFIQPVPFR